MYVIYSLVDPRDHTTRYVGMTNDVYERFLSHLSCNGNNFRRDEWIQELKAANVMVIMQTLEVVTNAPLARIREAYWIHHYLQLGVLLYNNQIPTPVHLKTKQQQKVIVRQLKNGRSELSVPSNLQDKLLAVVALQAKGGTKPEIMKEVWDVYPGNSQAYRDANEEYKQIMGTIAERLGA
jgi:GIY-YIG catalytic domain